MSDENNPDRPDYEDPDIGHEVLEGEILEPSSDPASQPVITSELATLPKPNEVPAVGLVVTATGRAVEFQEIQPGLDARVVIATDKATRIVTTPRQLADLKCPGMPWQKAQEVLMLCRRSCVDPYGGELFIDKKRNERGTYDYLVILSKRLFFRLAQSHPEFDRFTYVEFPDPADCDVNKPVVWGKASVWRKGWAEPYTYVLFYDEAISAVGTGGKAYKRSGYCTAQPRQYLRLVCLARAFRDAFADILTGFYEEHEIK
jgi:hypothetical protein